MSTVLPDELDMIGGPARVGVRYSTEVEEEFDSARGAGKASKDSSELEA